MAPIPHLWHKPEGISRQLTTFDPETGNKTTPLPAGRRVTVGQTQGAGVITRIWLTFPGWFWPHWAPQVRVDHSVFKALILRLYWDGTDTPAVEVPVGDFFGAGHCEYNSFTSRFVGTSSGGFFSYWPMPYRTGFRIEFENRDTTRDHEVFLNINYQQCSGAIDEARYFCTQFHTGRRAGPDEALVLDTQGDGHFTGLLLAMQGEPMNYLRFLEAPEYVCIDDDWDTPRIVGTGLEDYFNGGWYFREGTFAGPVHGVPLKDPFRSMITMYRFHELDAISFDRRIRMTFRNPRPASELHPYWYAAVACYYNAAPTPPQPPLANHATLMHMYRVRDRDHQAIP